MKSPIMVGTALVEPHPEHAQGDPASMSGETAWLGAAPATAGEARLAVPYITAPAPYGLTGPV
jgi:hypothetical protein